MISNNELSIVSVEKGWRVEAVVVPCDVVVTLRSEVSVGKVVVLRSEVPVGDFEVPWSEVVVLRSKVSVGDILFLKSEVSIGGNLVRRKVIVSEEESTSSCFSWSTY